MDWLQPIRNAYLLKLMTNMILVISFCRVHVMICTNQALPFLELVCGTPSLRMLSLVRLSLLLNLMLKNIFFVNHPARNLHVTVYVFLFLHGALYYLFLVIFTYIDYAYLCTWLLDLFFVCLFFPLNLEMFSYYWNLYSFDSYSRFCHHMC
jgi:hypothetical protein